MKCNMSYSIGLKHEYRCIQNTITYYRSCVKFLIDIVSMEFYNTTTMTKLEFQNYIEKCVHNTSSNMAKYPSFDDKFYKFPSYLRRAAISEAVGIVRSYKSLLQNWELTKQGKKPHLNRNRAVMPCFFKKNMFEMTGSHSCKIKLYINNDWRWKEFIMKKSDIDYIRRYFSSLDISPVIEKRNKKYALRFLFQKETKLPEKVSTVCAVDLGINHDAVCSILKEDGTVIARKFINYAIEKDHLYRIVNQIKKAQSKGNRRTPKLWRYADNYNKAICNDTVKDIVCFVAEYDVDCIVCEHLEMKGKLHGSKKQKLHLWRKKEILRKIEARAHREGMRFTTVSATRTSKLAYDGSGKVKRNSNNYSLCTFVTGKQYNCDLNASYNIGARYFIREKLKTLSESKRLAIEAKVPECAKRTDSTLSTLISLDAVLSA